MSHAAHYNWCILNTNLWSATISYNQEWSAWSVIISICQSLETSYDQSDGSPLPPSRPGPLAYYWTLLSNPPVLYKFQQPPCCLLGAAPLVNYTTIQLSKYPTTQILNYLLFKWGPNNILRLLKQAHYTFNGMWVGETNYQNIQQPNCFTIQYGDPTLSSSN